MSAVNILKFGISSPADTSPLAELKKAGYDASQILAVIGKTEGVGEKSSLAFAVRILITRYK
jgi:cyanuric acid amidohydrolase